MDAKAWEKQLVDFLKRSGEDIKRAGEDMKVEAQRLFEEMTDRDTQDKIRTRLKEFSGWAKKAAEDAAGAIEGVASKLEVAVNKAAERGIHRSAGGPDSNASGSGGSTSTAHTGWSSHVDPPTTVPPAPSSSSRPRKAPPARSGAVTRSVKTVGKTSKKPARPVSKSPGPRPTKTIGRRKPK